MEQSRNAHRVLAVKPEGKRPLGKPRRRLEDNFKMDLREVGCDFGDWIDLAQDMDQWRAYVRAPQLILQPFRRFTYVTAHSPSFPLLHLRHSSFSNSSFASPTSQALHLIHLASLP